MSVSVRTRFEVFKRDRFTCHYCGRTPPNVLLQVDHVQPVSAGGSDDEANLITSCQDCNAGKSDRLLEEGSRPAIGALAVDELRERVAQAEAYAELHERLRRLQVDARDEVVAAWAQAFGATLIEAEDGATWRMNSFQRFPEERSIRYFIRSLPLEEILTAIDRTASRFSRANEEACRYFYGTCHGKIRDRRQPQ